MIIEREIKIKQKYKKIREIKSMNDAQLETYKKMLEELKTYANEKREKLLQRLPNTSMGVATLTHDFRF